MSKWRSESRVAWPLRSERACRAASAIAQAEKRAAEKIRQLSPKDKSKTVDERSRLTFAMEELENRQKKAREWLTRQQLDVKRSLMKSNSYGGWGLPRGGDHKTVSSYEGKQEAKKERKTQEDTAKKVSSPKSSSHLQKNRRKSLLSAASVARACTTRDYSIPVIEDDSTDTPVEKVIKDLGHTSDRHFRHRLHTLFGFTHVPHAPMKKQALTAESEGKEMRGIPSVVQDEVEQLMKDWPSTGAKQAKHAPVKSEDAKLECQQQDTSEQYSMDDVAVKGVSSEAMEHGFQYWAEDGPTGYFSRWGCAKRAPFAESLDSAVVRPRSAKVAQVLVSRKSQGVKTQPYLFERAPRRVTVMLTGVTACVGPPGPEGEGLAMGASGQYLQKRRTSRNERAARAAKITFSNMNTSTGRGDRKRCTRPALELKRERLRKIYNKTHKDDVEACRVSDSESLRQASGEYGWTPALRPHSAAPKSSAVAQGSTEDSGPKKQSRGPAKYVVTAKYEEFPGPGTYQPNVAHTRPSSPSANFSSSPPRKEIGAAFFTAPTPIFEVGDTIGRFQQYRRQCRPQSAFV